MRDIATVALGVQFVGLQYNDDLNVNFIPAADADRGRLRRGYPAGLPGYTSVDLSVSRNFGRNLQAFFGVQNLLDKDVLRADQPVDDRHAASGQRRRAGALLRPIKKKPGERLIFFSE